MYTDTYTYTLAHTRATRVLCTEFILNKYKRRSNKENNSRNPTAADYTIPRLRVVSPSSPLR